MQGLLQSRNSSSKPPARKPILRCLALVLPLLSCAANKLHVDYKPPVADRNETCFLEGGVRLSYEHAGKRTGIELDAEGIVPLRVFCQDKRTIIVTKDTIIRSLGLEDIAAGREMIGLLPDPEDRFRPENVVVLGIAPLESGRIIAAMASENILTIITESGKVWRVDVDMPTKPVMQIRLVDSGEFLNNHRIYNNG